MVKILSRVRRKNKTERAAPPARSRKKVSISNVNLPIACKGTTFHPNQANFLNKNLHKVKKQTTFATVSITHSIIIHHTMTFILFIIIFFLCLLMGGWEMVLIVFGCGIGAAILQYLGIGRPKFNKATEEAIRRGEISWQQAYENARNTGGFTGYMDEEEWEADRAEEKRKQDEASKRILEYNRKHFGMN